MARDSDRYNAYLESARREVTFDIKDLEETIFLNKRDPTAHARRRSRFGENVSVGLEEQNIFDDIPPEKFEECRYDITTESLNSAIQNGVIDLATSMLDHLEALYGDPERKRKAENEWDKLCVIDPESYGNKINDVSYLRFRNAFCRLAAELQKPRSEWKSAFERRISPIFQKALALQFLDENIDFDIISKVAAKLNFTFASADAELQARREAKKALSNATNSRNGLGHNLSQVAGVGASVDPGIPRGEYHPLPWDITEKSLVRIVDAGRNTPVEIEVDKRIPWYEIDTEEVLKIAKYNLEHVFNFQESIIAKFNIEKKHADSLYKDMLCILTIMISLNYHHAETRVMTDTEKKTVANSTITADDTAIYNNTMHFDRAATFIMSRVHTKYLANHANTQIKGAYVPKAGPLPSYLPAEEYFDIRSDTAPASTHHFLVAAAAIKAIKLFGLLRLLPEPTRLVEVSDGLQLIRDYGAALHPAARYWGLNKQSAGQKSVEPLCADLGYTVKKLLPNSSLKNSPILRKEDQLNGAWKTVIDSIRIELDKRSETMVSAKVLKMITTRVAPRINKEPNTDRIFRLMVDLLKDLRNMSTEISAKEEVPNIPGTLLEYPSERDKRAKDREERSREIESRIEEWGNRIDPDKYSPSQLNQYVLWRLTNYQNRERTFEKKMDTEYLFNEFWEDFNTFESSHFKMLARDVIRPLRHFLRDHGVWVKNEKTYSTAKSLYDCTRSENNIWLDEGHDSENSSAEQNENDTKDSSNSNNTKTEPISFNPARYNQTRKHPEPHQIHKDIANLTRTYNDEINYSGETSDNFDDKLNIFMDYCTRFGISSQALHDSFPCMLKGMALTFYYNKCR
ncbi:hypothetical protein EPUL_003123, partial [Erysiphe pulchra]